jgi:zinc and cadmium transporter
MTTFIYIMISTLLISALSLVGALTLVFKESFLKKITIPLVAFSAGALLGGAFMHLIPEAVEKIDNIIAAMLWVLFGFIVFFILEQFIHWHHCHRMPSEHKHPVTYLILISDSVHNFLDGLAVAAAFIISPSLGVAATLAVAAHEVPQELGDFGILIHGGWGKGKALLFNFLSGLTMVLGGIIAFILARGIEIVYLLPFAAGNFIYIAASDLVPEIKHCDNVRRNLLHLASFLLGLLLMYGLLFLEIA